MWFTGLSIIVIVVILLWIALKYPNGFPDDDDDE